MFARSQNALRGRWENFWSSEQLCVVKIVDRDAVMDKLVYTATNPVHDHLVDRVHHWPGAHSLAELLAGRCLRAKRPRHFFRPDGPMPEVVEMRLTLPPELGPAAELLAQLRDRVPAVEVEREAERRHVGQPVLGRRAVLAQSWRDHPTNHEPRRSLRPRVATRSKWARIEALLRNRAFAEDYVRARERGRAGAPVAFPPGTYWLRRFAYVPVAET
jgi:putative transposase